MLSSAIEGTVSSLSDPLFELDETPGVPVEDAIEVSHYVAALDHATAMQRGGLPIDNRMLRETHRILLSHGRGTGKSPGEYRRLLTSLEIAAELPRGRRAPLFCYRDWGCCMRSDGLARPRHRRPPSAPTAKSPQCDTLRLIRSNRPLHSFRSFAT